jgi:lipid II:glycine glycyltransferase (peptidoglycan interpeptide bridge formation enzyme)
VVEHKGADRWSNDNFQRIIEEANKPGSIIKQKNIIEIDPDTYEGRKEVVVAKTSAEEKMEAEKLTIEAMPESEEKVKAATTLEIKKTIYETIPQVNNEVRSVHELSQTDIKDIVVAKVKEQLLSSAQRRRSRQPTSLPLMNLSSKRLRYPG